jgi:crotonobetainyl-CoA:carnitine CoA-transferase CaiB-like acyl-CoA transferase
VDDGTDDGTDEGGAGLAGWLDATLGRAGGWPQADADALVDGPLRGVRVLDLSRVLAGPYATMVLADLGADVLKVERPGSGDDIRAWGPPFHGDTAAYFLSVNRGRRSLTVDLATPAGATLVAHLARHADVVVENFLPRHLAGLGLDAVRDACPHTVWVSIRAAAGDGPAGDLPGYDVLAQARGGLMSVTGDPAHGPTKVGVAIGDVLAGLHAAVSALAGLVGTGRGGPAARVEVGLLETVVAGLVNQAANHLVGGLVPGPLGNAHPNLAPYGPLACADGLLVVGVGNDRQFAALCGALGLPALATDPRFATNADRLAHRDALVSALEDRLAAGDVATWRAALEAAGVPCAPVQDLPAVAADEQVVATGLVVEVEHPAGPLAQVRAPVRVDGVRPPVARRPPALGEHTEEVLAALGCDADLVAALRTTGAV